MDEENVVEEVNEEPTTTDPEPEPISVTDSILASVRENLGGELFPNPAEQSPFDSQLIMHINSALFILSQRGVGTYGFAIKGYTETWDDFIGETNTDMELLKTTVFMRVKLMFDPPSSSVLLGHYKDQINEYEWRLQERAEFNA